MAPPPYAQGEGITTLARSLPATHPTPKRSLGTSNFMSVRAKLLAERGSPPSNPLDHLKQPLDIFELLGVIFTSLPAVLMKIVFCKGNFDSFLGIEKKIKSSWQERQEPVDNW